MSQSSEFQNVHIYDTQLRNIFSPKNYSIEYKERLFEGLLTQLRNPHSKEMVRLIYQDMRQPNGGANYDPANNIDASELLADILSTNYTEVLTYLEEQLQDNSMLGRCPQGRSTRLIQIWRSLNSRYYVFKHPESGRKVVIERLGDIISLYSPHKQVNHWLGSLQNKDMNTIIRTLRANGYQAFQSHLYKAEGNPDITVDMLDGEIVLVEPKGIPTNREALRLFLAYHGYHYIQP